MLAYDVFSAERPGKRLLLLGTVHGNETCGYFAVERLREKIISGELLLESGEITTVPISNERVFRQGVRLTEDNLNRSFFWLCDGHFLIDNVNKIVENEDLGNQFDMRAEMGDIELQKKAGQAPSSYEQERAKELARLFVSKDAEIDIHSQTAEGESYCFGQNESLELKSYLNALGTKNIIYGWDKMYPEGDFTSENLAEKMGILGTTVECGSHENPDSIEFAWRIILNALKYLKIISDKTYLQQFVQMDEKYRYQKISKNLRMIKMYRWIDGGKMTHDWKHLETINEGDIIAHTNSGETIIAEEDCLMILPNYHPIRNNEEWFYLAKIED